MLFKIRKDGGPDSHVTGFFLVEWKQWFTVAVLRFSNGSRDAYHNHAFNAWSWVLRGGLYEEVLSAPEKNRFYKRSLRPISTPCNMFHKVTSVGTTWVITFRGPWANTWQEYIPERDEFIVLTHGREVVQ